MTATPNHSGRIRAVFAGTPEFAVPSLHCLQAHPAVDLVGAYTQPDRRAGRGRRVQVSPVKSAALAFDVPIHQPVNFKDAAAITAFQALRADLFVVAAYGLILPSTVIDSPRLSVNVHASSLPRWRGAAPIQRAIMAGDNTTGISMMRVVPALDAGPVLLHKSCAIEKSDTGGCLHDKLAALGAECLRAVIDAFIDATLVETVQDDSQATYASKILAADRVLDFTKNAEILALQVRALNPTPIASMRFLDLNVKVWSAHALAAKTGNVTPGALVGASEDGVDFATGDGLLRVTQLQPEGKRPMSAAEFVNGFNHLLDPR